MTDDLILSIVSNLHSPISIIKPADKVTVHYDSIYPVLFKITIYEFCSIQ